MHPRQIWHHSLPYFCSSPGKGTSYLLCSPKLFLSLYLSSFLFSLYSFHARSSHVSAHSYWSKKGRFPFTAQLPWTSHASLALTKCKAVLNCTVSITFQHKFQNRDTAAFLSLWECSECTRYVSTKPLGCRETFQTRPLPSHNWTWVTFASWTCMGIESLQVRTLKCCHIYCIGMRLWFCVINMWSDYFAA